MRPKNKHKSNYEWPMAMLVGVTVTLACVIQNVDPPTTLIRVAVAVTSVLVIGKLSALAVKLILEHQPR